MSSIASQVHDVLTGFRGPASAKELFALLNYEYVDEVLSLRELAPSSQEAVAEVSLLARCNDFHIIYSRLKGDRLLLSPQRAIINSLLRQHPYSLFMFSDADQAVWHFVNVKHDPEIARRRLFRRIVVGETERLHTAADRLAKLDVEDEQVSPLDLQERHDDAFDVEQVTKQFFTDYSNKAFGPLWKHLEKKTKERTWAHDYALQFLNRLMFLYFVQRKRWLGDALEFIDSMWKGYQKSNQPKDTFVERWLSVLFFEAFNNKFQAGRSDRQHLPPDIRRALALAPFLNGGLFKQTELDSKCQHFEATISDELFEQVFNFFQHYNFTVREDTPLDQEVAVDPEMIGKVYESLVNLSEPGSGISEAADRRGEAGIFYTQRTEIELMCRLSLVEYFHEHIPDADKNILYDLVFAQTEEEKEAADAEAVSGNLWPAIDMALEKVTVLDPACGSGSFLVGMLKILADLASRANSQLGDVESTPYQIKKDIIGRSLYGVDVMDWAVRVAELRLWLQLVVDTELEAPELKWRALLPDLTFKIREGDSLVQEIGGINLAVRHATGDISAPLKERLTALKAEKLRFYNDPTRKFKSEDELKQEELNIFRDIIDDERHALRERAKQLRDYIAHPAQQQDIFPGPPKAKQLELHTQKWKEELADVNERLERVSEARAALATPEGKPFVWEIDFAEIFSGEKDGFDIVIGNPPYVRQENIADPRLPRHEATRPAAKRAYKEKLQAAVLAHFSTKLPPRLDKKADLYIYFFYHGLSLLNPRGTFCFITSNSWLDVGYGAQLQELLLRNCHVKAVIDNAVKRSFKASAINTVISLFSAPLPGHDKGLEKTARFVMFGVPFDEVLTAATFKEIERAKDRTSAEQYRVSPVSQDTLLEEGWKWPEEVTEEAKKSFGFRIAGSKYAGNKWGGKYLRAPDIYWTIVEKGKGKLVRLGDIAQVRFGIKTGANEFFYLDKERIREWGIEEEFLRPVIKSPRECKRIIISPEELKFRIFMCHEGKNDLRGTAALEYIKWGESQGFHKRPSCAGRRRWWDLGERRIPSIISPSSVSELPRTFANEGVLADKRLYEVYPGSSLERESVLIATNAVTCSLFLELGSRTGLGEGLLDLTVYELADCLIAIPPASEKLDSVLREACGRDFLPLREELQHPNRRALDGLIFDVIGLTQGERDAVYEAVVNLVEARLKKAGSV